jgi:phospholipase C
MKYVTETIELNGEITNENRSFYFFFGPPSYSEILVSNFKINGITSSNSDYKVTIRNANNWIAISKTLEQSMEGFSFIYGPESNFDPPVILPATGTLPGAAIQSEILSAAGDIPRSRDILPWSIKVDYTKPDTITAVKQVKFSLTFTSTRNVISRKIPLDLLNKKLDYIFNDPQTLKVVFTNKKILTPVYNPQNPDNEELVDTAFIDFVVDPEMVNVYGEIESINITKLTKEKLPAIYVTTWKIQRKEKIIIKAISHEGYFGFKVSINYTIVEIDIWPISDLFDNIPLNFSLLFIYYPSGFKVIVDSDSEPVINILLSLIAPDIGGIFKGIINALKPYVFGDIDTDFLGANDEEAELYYAPKLVMGDVNTDVMLLKKTDVLPVPGSVFSGYYSTNGAGDIIYPNKYDVLNREWSHIVPGHFGNSSYTGYFFYSPTGLGEIYTSDGKGNITLLKQVDGLPTNCTKIVPGFFSDDGYTGLFFYSPAGGQASFYKTDAAGNISLLLAHSGWSHWDIMIGGNFTNNKLTDLLFYRESDSTLQIFKTDGSGDLKKIFKLVFTNKWTHIITGNFSNSPWSNILFYDQSSGLSRFCTWNKWRDNTDTEVYSITVLREGTGWQKTWDQIIPLKFSDSYYDGLLFYDKENGFAQIYKTDGKGSIKRYREHNDWGKDITLIIPGNFGGQKIEPAPMEIPAEDIATLTEKIDHIVVIMLENRSFDHMLGHLSLPLSEGGANRRDVNGLTGNENNPFHPFENSPVRNVFPFTKESPSVQSKNGYSPKVTKILYDPAHDHKFSVLQRGNFDCNTQTYFSYLANMAHTSYLLPDWEYHIDPMKGFIIANTIRLLAHSTYDLKWEDTDNIDVKNLRGEVMGYYTKEHVPTFGFLADNFLVCDNWYASIPGHTWQNRFTAISGILYPDERGVPVPDNPELSTFDPSEQLTIFDHLDEAGKTWKYYEHDFSMLRTFSKYTFDENNIRPIDEFFKDVKQGNLPDVIYIDPDLSDVSSEMHPANDDHPPANISRGQDLISRIYNALRDSPKWDKTLFIVTYDEHGGFYDHVLPEEDPNLPALFTWPDFYNDFSAYTSKIPENRFFEKPIRYRGMRVPAFIISPHVVPKSVSHKVFDHTTILKTIIARFLSVNPPFMGMRVHKADSLASVISNPSPGAVPPVAPNIDSSSFSREWTKAAPKDYGHEKDFHYIFNEIRKKYKK